MINETQQKTTRGEKMNTKADASYGFDLTNFKQGGFQRVLKALGITPIAKDMETKWYWEGNGILIITGNDPITGKYATTSPIKRKDEKNYASYMGLVGTSELVRKTVALIHKHTDFIKNESPGTREYI